MYVPEPVFKPEYLSGTRPASAYYTLATSQALLCEQATDAESTISPFHVAIFGSGIAPPGKTAENTTTSYLGHELVTNHRALEERGETAGFLSSPGLFSLVRPVPPLEEAEASPYTFAVPKERPLFDFKGSLSGDPPASNTASFVWNYYAKAESNLFLMRIEFVGHPSGPGQPAVTTFAPETYWARRGGPMEFESINFLHEVGSGSLSIETISAF